MPVTHSEPMKRDIDRSSSSSLELKKLRKLILEPQPCLATTMRPVRWCERCQNGRRLKRQRGGAPVTSPEGLHQSIPEADASGCSQYSLTPLPTASFVIVCLLFCSSFLGAGFLIRAYAQIYHIPVRILLNTHSVPCPGRWSQKGPQVLSDPNPFVSQMRKLRPGKLSDSTEVTQ